MKLLLLLFLLIFFSVCNNAFAQQVSLNGKVTDQNGKPVPFASIYIKNTTAKALLLTVKGTTRCNYKPVPMRYNIKPLVTGRKAARSIFEAILFLIYLFPPRFMS